MREFACSRNLGADSRQASGSDRTSSATNSRLGLIALLGVECPRAPCIAMSESVR